jgi:2-succinyl-5-enolpyruvyl-6-hydroxy-3-cyclohexene-1-carboxylate synthase
VAGKALVLIGGLDARYRDRVRDFCLRSNRAVYAEPLSGLREDPALDGIRIRNERMLSRGNFDSVIRIGNVPTLRFWRDLDAMTIPVTHYSDLPFAGMTRGEVRPLSSLSPRERVVLSEAKERVRGVIEEDREKYAAIQKILDDEPQSELAMVRALSEKIPHGARIYLGNSLPIREWDLAATREPRGFAIEANRGANGIDGQLSTFFGWCQGANNWCIVGDLTALYDANAPWIVPQLDAQFEIVIINNGGGRIFNRVASLRRMDPQVRERLVENAHDLRFDKWAEMWRIRIQELIPDAGATRRVWEKYDALWS